MEQTKQNERIIVAAAFVIPISAQQTETTHTLRAAIHIQPNPYRVFRIGGDTCIRWKDSTTTTTSKSTRKKNQEFRVLSTTGPCCGVAIPVYTRDFFNKLRIHHGFLT